MPREYQGRGSVTLNPLQELLCQALEAALACVAVHRTARACALDGELFRKWDGQLRQYENRARVFRHSLEELGLDPEEDVPGRLSIRYIGQALVKAMQMALVSGDPGSTQRVAVRCVALAQADEGLHWELIGQVGMNAEGKKAQVLSTAWDQIDDEDESERDDARERSRQLWLDFLGLSPVYAFPSQAPEADAGRSPRSSERLHDRKRWPRLVQPGDETSEGLAPVVADLTKDS